MNFNIKFLAECFIYIYKLNKNKANKIHKYKTKSNIIKTGNL